VEPALLVGSGAGDPGLRLLSSGQHHVDAIGHEIDTVNCTHCALVASADRHSSPEAAQHRPFLREDRGGMSRRAGGGWGAVLGPGLLVAATGVGAGDLVTASLAGSEVGLVVVWAALLGAGLKWTLNEGVARWQLATGTTLLEGWHSCLGGWFSWLFLVYFLLWTFAVGGALVNACGIAATAFFTVGDAETSKIVWGVLHSIAGALLVWRGGFERFERVMAVCVGVMVVSVVMTATLIAAEAPAAIVRGVFLPAAPFTDRKSVV
jgi:Mn2+/Fe2+ NRAMP family transporter